MRDVFYTILTVWIVWKIYNAFISVRSYNNTSNHQSKEGSITIKKTEAKPNHIRDDEGEYVDFEEIK